MGAVGFLKRGFPMARITRGFEGVFFFPESEATFYQSVNASLFPKVLFPVELFSLFCVYSMRVCRQHPGCGLTSPFFRGRLLVPVCLVLLLPLLLLSQSSVERLFRK